MSIKKDLAKIAVQEERLQFQDFDADTAWKLGNRLKANAETRGVAVTMVDIGIRAPTIAVDVPAAEVAAHHPDATASMPASSGASMAGSMGGMMDDMMRGCRGDECGRDRRHGADVFDELVAGGLGLRVDDRIARLVRYLYVQFALATGKVVCTVRVQLDVQFPFGMDIHQAFRHGLTVGIV